MHTQNFPTAHLGRFVMMVIGTAPRTPPGIGPR